MSNPTPAAKTVDELLKRCIAYYKSVTNDVDFAEQLRVAEEHDIYEIVDKQIMDNALSREEAKLALRQAFTNILKRVIGDDGQVTGYLRSKEIMNVNLTQSYHNGLRVEQRTRAKTELDRFFGKEANNS